MKINIGLHDKDRKDIANGLARALADTYVLYLKTQNFHWNVTGPHFHDLHLLFESQYEELAEAVDLLAERIRALGFPTPASFAQFSQLTSIKEEQGVPPANDMVKQLLHDHEKVIKTLYDVIAKPEAANDVSTVDLYTIRLTAHTKAAWMLRSILM